MSILKDSKLKGLVIETIKQDGNTISMESKGNKIVKLTFPEEDRALMEMEEIDSGATVSISSDGISLLCRNMGKIARDFGHEEDETRFKKRHR